jgi:hypothetical protein
MQNSIRLLTFSILILGACGTIKPNSPKIEVANYIPPKQEASLISIPIEMELKSYFKAADNAVPMKFNGNQKQCEGVSFAYDFERKPILIEGKGSSVDINIEGKYGLSLSYCTKCTDYFSSSPTCITPRIPASCGVGESMRRIKIQYGTAIELKKDFKIDATTELKKLEPIDKCEITVFKYDATGHLVKEVKKALSDLGLKIDQEIESLDIKKQAEEIWQSLTKPFPIEGFGFLEMNPNAIEVENLRIKGSKLMFNIGVKAFPQVSLSKPSEKIIPLPNLTELKNEEGLNINVQIVATYDSLNSILNQHLFGKIIDIKNQQIILQQTKIYGAQNQQLTIEVDFIGSKKGKMFFIGTPTINDTTQVISFPDLSFDVATKNVLLKSAKWMFNNKITNMISQYAIFDLKKQLKDISKTIEAQMNSKITNEINLKGKLKETKVKSIFPDKDALIIQTKLTGKLGVIIN